MSLMIPADLAKGAMHASNEDWGGMCHTWSSDLRPPARGWSLLGTMLWQWTAGTDDVDAVVFPPGTASQAFQVGCGGRD